MIDVRILPGRDRRARLSLLDAVAAAASGAWSRPLRAALSALGVALGVAALVAVVTVTLARQAQVRADLDALGANLLVVEPGSLPDGSPAELPRTAPEMIRRIGPVQHVAAVRALDDVGVQRNDLGTQAQAGGVVPVVADPELLGALDLALAEGRWFDPTEDHLPVAVLGAVAADRLGLDPGTATRARIRVGGAWVAVRGVLEPAELAPSVDSAVLLAAPPAADRPDPADDEDTPPITSVYVRTQTGAAESVRSVLRETASPGAPTSVAVARLSELARAQDTTDEALSGLTVGLAAITIAVGAVGIANTMVVAVLERRREIGLRRALGARPGQIRGQFMLEAAMLGLAGGISGALGGTAVASAVVWSSGAGLHLYPAVLLGAVASACALGALAGTYPAVRASRVPPAAALRG